ncbi:MAG: hypothetical protein ACI9LY_003442 [Arenicella sp.]|jgi:hypothetical protein
MRLTHSYAGINRIRFKGSVRLNAHISGKYLPLGLLHLLEWNGVYHDIPNGTALAH